MYTTTYILTNVSIYDAKNCKSTEDSQISQKSGGSTSAVIIKVGAPNVNVNSEPQSQQCSGPVYGILSTAWLGKFLRSISVVSVKVFCVLFFFKKRPLHNNFQWFIYSGVFVVVFSSHCFFKMPHFAINLISVTHAIPPNYHFCTRGFICNSEQQLLNWVLKKKENTPNNKKHDKLIHCEPEWHLSGKRWHDLIPNEICIDSLSFLCTQLSDF